MKVTLKLHPSSQHDLTVLADVMHLIAKKAEFETSAQDEDKTGLAKTVGPVTQEAIKTANEKYVAPSQPKQPVEQKTQAAVTPVVAPVSASAITAPVAPVSVAPPAAPESTAGEVDIQTLRTKTQEKILAGFREEVKGFLAEMKVPSVTSLTPDQYQAFNDKLDSLKKKE